MEFTQVIIFVIAVPSNDPVQEIHAANADASDFLYFSDAVQEQVTDFSMLMYHCLLPVHVNR